MIRPGTAHHRAADIIYEQMRAQTIHTSAQLFIRRDAEEVAEHVLTEFGIDPQTPWPST